LEAVFQLYHTQFLRMILKALEHQRPLVLDLLRLCGYRFSEEEDVMRQFDTPVLKCILNEDFSPIERLCRLGFSVRRFAERNQADFQAFVQSRLEASPSASSGGHRPGVHPAIRRLAGLDRRALELHFRSQTFLQFVETLLAKKSFVILRQIVEVHQYAFDAYFMEHYAPLEAILVDAFMLRDTSLIVDLASLSFPMGPFFKRRQAELDSVLLNTWFPNKCWTDLGMLKTEVRQWSFPAFFDRNQWRSDDFVVSIIENGYWFDLHNLAQLSFDFPSFFDRRFNEVSTAVVNFITIPHPHFVLLRELSALSFPWGRFMQAHRKQIPRSKDHDFLQFVISLDGFELGSKVYDVVKQTTQLYHSMAASMFNVHGAAAQAHLSACHGRCTLGPLAAGGDEVSAGDLSTALGEPAEPCSPSSSSSSPAPAQRQLRAAGVGAEVAGEAATSSEGGGTGCCDGTCSFGGSSSSRAGTGDRRVDTALLDAALESGCGSSAQSVRGSSAARGAPAASGQAEHQASEVELRVTEAARLRMRAKDLVRKAREKKLDLKKVLMLTVCKGAYCWNPLKVDTEDPQDGKEPNVWAEIESVLNFLESQDDVVAAQSGSIYSHLLPHHVQALAVGVPGGAAVTAGVVGVAGGAVAVPHLGVPAPVLAGHPAGFSLPPPLHLSTGGAHGPSSQQLLFHVVCLAQRGEERAFVPKVELFWDGILDTVLPLTQAL